MTFLPIYLSLATTPVLSDEPGLTLRLCRAFVEPCQAEVNLDVGGEVTLGLHLDSTDSLAPAQPLSLVAWYLKVLFLGDDPVEISGLRTTGRPFQEQGSPNLALNNLRSLQEHPPQSASEAKGYYRVRNGYEQEPSTAEYGVTLVTPRAGGQTEVAIRFPEEGSVLIGNISLKGAGIGTTQLLAAESAAHFPQVVLADGSGGLSQAGLEGAGLLAMVNVGPTAEKSRLQGQVWSDLPASGEFFHPFTKTFEVEFWRAGALPASQGGPDHLTAKFTSLSADSEGNYYVPDLSPQLLPTGSYDIRARGAGTLTVLEQDVHIDTSGNSGQPLPVTVNVSLGPLPSGDLTGDNRVDEDDLSHFKSTFGNLVSPAEAEAAGDFNGDGVVDGQDFSLMAANYGRSGE